MVDGNEEISTLVKALAKYYRICLSGGHDVIPLKMELEHVRNYLIIRICGMMTLSEVNLTWRKLHLM